MQYENKKKKKILENIEPRQTNKNWNKTNERLKNSVVGWVGVYVDLVLFIKM